MGKKKIKKLSFLEAYKKLRQIWTINPVTKILPNKKKKSRAKIKQDLRKDLQDG